MYIKQDKKEDEEQTIKNGMEYQGCHAGLHVKKIHWLVPARKLEHEAWGQEYKEHGGYHQSCVIIHCARKTEAHILEWHVGLGPVLSSEEEFGYHKKSKRIWERTLYSLPFLSICESVYAYCFK